MRTSSITLASIVAIAAACGNSVPSADSLNDDVPLGGATATGGTTSTGGTEVTGGATATGGTSGSDTGGSVATGGSVPTGGTNATGGTVPTGGTGATAPIGGTGGDGTMTGGSAGSGAAPTGGIGGSGGSGTTGGTGMTGGSAGAATGGSGGMPPAGPYAPRSGTFKMLVYSRTTAFRHTDSITTGKAMLRQIATEQGFTVTETEMNTDITPTGLAQYEVVFFMNTTGDIFNATEQTTFETWMKTKNGGFAGVHSATDTENGWTFYSEVTGQYYDLHEPCCGQGSIQWDPGQTNNVIVRGLPSPWQRSEEWYNFNRSSTWSIKPGFVILGRVTINNVSRPVSFTREFENWRSFYTSLGHQGSVFQDANVKKHVAAGIMWVARRDHLLVQ
jgi:type 1 glutamine amidotransferase